MPFVNLSTGSVHYTEHGQGTPLLLLHANPGDSQDFYAIIPALSKHYRVIALDWPGYGQSSTPKQPETVGILFFYQALCEFLVALSLPPAYLIGNSLGGNVAARLAIEKPEAVRGLVLVAPGGFTPINFITRSFCAFQGSRFALSPYHFASLYIKQQTVTTQAMLVRAATSQATPERIKLNRAIWRSFGTPDNDLRPVAHRIKAPTLLLFGKHDPVISANRDGLVASAIIPYAKFIVLACGHASFAEIPELFLENVEPFLSAINNHGQTGH